MVQHLQRNIHLQNTRSVEVGLSLAYAFRLESSFRSCFRHPPGDVQDAEDAPQQSSNGAAEEQHAGNRMAPAADDRLAHNQWQGRDIEFMQSNAHSRERQGKWDTSGLEGAALQIVSSDEKAAK